MHLHLLRTSLLLLGVHLRRAASQALDRLARRIEPATGAQHGEAGDSVAPAHWLRDIRAYGQEPRWISFVAPGLGRQAEALHNTRYPDPNHPRRDRAAQTSPGQPAPDPSSLPPDNDTRQEESRQSKPARDFPRLRFSGRQNRRDTRSPAGSAHSATLHLVDHASWPALADEPHHVRISYPGQVAQRAPTAYEHHATDTPATEPARAMSFPVDAVSHAGAGGARSEPRLGNTGYNQRPQQKHDAQPAKRKPSLHRNNSPPWKPQADSVNTVTTGNNEVSAQEEVAAAISGIQPHQWPELPDQNEHRAQRAATSEMLELHREEWLRRQRLDSEQRGIEWNESPS